MNSFNDVFEKSAKRFPPPLLIKAVKKKTTKILIKKILHKSRFYVVHVPVRKRVRKLVIRKCKKIRKKDVDLRKDLAFVDELLEKVKMDVHPEMRELLLRAAYTMTRDKIKAAFSFALQCGRSRITTADLEMTRMEQTAELAPRGWHPEQQPLSKLVPGNKVLTGPAKNEGLILPTWRNCQVGVSHHLKSDEKTEEEKAQDSKPPVSQCPKNPPAVFVGGALVQGRGQVISRGGGRVNAGVVRPLVVNRATGQTVATFPNTQLTLSNAKGPLKRIVK